MVELDGIEYQVKSVDENTTDVINYINQYCANNNVRNTKGELIYIDENPTNPLYMMMYGVGYLTTALQKLVQSVGAGTSVASSSERQLLNLAEVAKVHRDSATRTTISCLVYAAGDDCQITKTLSATVNYGGQSVVFRPAFEVLIPGGSATNVLLVADTDGSFSIAAGTITQFDQQVNGLGQIIQSASIPGSDRETIAELRNRIQKRDANTTVLDKTADAIRQLDGVSRCSIYFNSSTTQDTIVNGITVAPRHALLIAQGFSDEIAQTFYKYMLCETTQGPAERTVTQNYVTHANQNMPVYIIEPETVTLNIKVYLNRNLSDAEKIAFKNTICELSSNTFIGQSVTSAQVINLLKDKYPTYDVQGCLLSQSGMGWSYKQTPEPDQLFVYNIMNISIEETT